MSAMAAFGAAMGAINAHRSMKKENKMYEAYAAAHRYNAAATRVLAEWSGEAYNAKEDQKRRQSALALADAGAILKQSGTGSGGSNADIERQNEIFAELDALNIRYEGSIAAAQSELSARGEEYQAYMNLQQRNSRTDMFIGMVGGALGGYSAGYGR